MLVHFDDRKPERPVILVEFTNHPEFQQEWLKHLVAFPQLSTLGLGGTPLKDEGMKYLRDLRELDTLVLSGTKITDKGLVELRTLKKLRFLSVTETAVTPAGATALRKYLPDLEVETDAPAGGTTSTDPAGTVTENPAPNETVNISAKQIKDLRGKIAALAPASEDVPEGWSKSRVNPAAIVALFRTVRLRKGLVLRAYQFREEGNGNGVVWAMPENAEFPAPEDCPTLEHHLLKVPKPWDALDDVMEAIEGDGSPASYMAASIVRRELTEFGAMWHGGNWNTHVVLDANPWKAGRPREEDSPLDRPTSPLEDWTWTEPRPTQWSPQIHRENDRVIVTFYTYSGLWKESIFRHTDTYRVGTYRPKTEQKRIAEGSGGFAF